MATRLKMGFEHLQRRDDPWARRPPAPPTPYDRALQAWADARYEYRLIVFDRPVTAWASRGDTQRAAIRMGHGSVCEQTGFLFLTVPAEMQRREADPPPMPPREPCCSKRRGR
ncbi:MAG: hypothetical protein QOI38_2046 [Sphingomonadales bacterium]|jgi:hypothetical protein|nr:hypothetical protein [Sphingomonadales bacterium]